MPEDARGIGIQISRLEIVKNKSRGTILTNFIKSKPSSMVQQSVEMNEGNEVQPVTNSNVAMTISDNTNNKQKLDIPPDVNKSVLSEFPEEIRNEILYPNNGKKLMEDNKDQATVSTQNTRKVQPQKSVQTRHESFFKQTKAGISRPTKVEMPPIQEIDMSVLIELPEDIRNEILNEYSIAKKNQNQTNLNTGTDSISSTSKASASETEINRDEQNISYSQVDPEFLEALPEDLRRDVQMYCIAKKAEHSSKIKKDETNNNGLMKHENTKQNKKVELNSKNKNSKNGKGTHYKNRKKNGQAALKTIKNANKSESVPENKTSTGIAKFIIPLEGKTESANDQILITADDTEAILSHNRTIAEDNDTANQYQDILLDLVNRLLNLPLKQVVFYKYYCYSILLL